MKDAAFCTVINCMDGRTQLPANEFLRSYFKADYVDTITEPGPIKILAEGAPAGAVESIVQRVRISVDKHGSRGIAVVAHYDCAGNPVDRRTQCGQLAVSLEFLRKTFPSVEVVPLWIGEDWRAELVAE